jgi:CubicO group peptidase (beta-lactamase class C family)
MTSIDSEIKQEIAAGIIHGAVVYAGTIQETFLAKAWGHADANGQRPMRIDTVFDLASVTKVLATTSALALCCDDGLVDLDAPFTYYLPEYAAPLPEPITVRELATHQSGLGQQSHYDAPEGPEIRRKILTTSPGGPRGKFEYSCWNFQLLGMVVENVAGCPLPEFCRKRIFEPLGMRETSLGSPLPTVPAGRLSRSFATDKPGQISDFVAFRLYRDGLTAGNAGAFSCAPDLVKFCRCLLQNGNYGQGERLFSAQALAAMSAVYIQDGPVQCGLGWLVADELKPPGFSAMTIYHSGWSG